MWYLYLLGFFLLICFYFALKVGLLKRIVPIEKQAGPFKIVYRNYRGNYQEIHYGFMQIINECHNKVKFAHTIGIYYDYPSPEKDMKKARAALGVVLENSETNQRIETFLKGNQAYKYAELPAVKTLHCTFPYSSPISNVLISLKVYPKLWEVYNKLSKKTSTFFGNVEIFKITDKKTDAQIFIPITEEGRDYFLTPYAEPGLLQVGKKNI